MLTIGSSWPVVVGELEAELLLDARELVIGQARSDLAASELRTSPRVQWARGSAFIGAAG
jgi:hypothetical protein